MPVIMSPAPDQPPVKVVSVAELKKHNTEEDCWVAIHGIVYDVSKFVNDHPGGAEVVTSLAGQEASSEFEDIGHSNTAREMSATTKYGICSKGILEGKEEEVAGYREKGWIESKGIPTSSLAGGGSDGSGAGAGIFAVVVMLGAVGYYYYTSLGVE